MEEETECQCQSKTNGSWRLGQLAWEGRMNYSANFFNQPRFNLELYFRVSFTARWCHLCSNPCKTWMNKELKWFRYKPFVLDGGQNNCTSNLVFRILCGSRRKRSRMFFLLLVNASRVFNGVQTQSMKKRWDFALKSKMIWYIFPPASSEWLRIKL